MDNKNWRFYQNYIIIAIISLVAIFILPLLGSSAGIGFNIPDTPAGWTVWIIARLCIVIVNVLIFDQFVKQGKVNVRDDENFIKAEEILNNVDAPEEEILSAKEYIHNMYKQKGFAVLITSVLSVFGLTNAILNFDWVSTLTYTITVVLSLVFGWISMNDAEIIWTEKHYKYALKVKRELEEKSNIEKETEDALNQ